MSGPVTLVTGGAKRIGKAIASGLAARGWPVIIHANDSTREAEALAGALTAKGAKAAVAAADLGNGSGAAGLVAQAARHFGPVEVLVNNASVFRDDSASDPDFANFDAHFALHVKAPLALTAAVVKALPPGSEGLAVNLIDQRVWALTPRFFTYTLSKSSLWTATQTMAQAFAPRFRVNAIGPGPTLPNDRQDAADFDRQVDGVILKRGPAMDEFAATVAYLWETKSVTGQMIALDGGQHLAWETPDIAGIRE